MKKAKPEVGFGWHNQNLELARDRLIKGNSYKDLSTVWVIPTRGVLNPKVVSSWIGLMRPMNQKVVGPFFIENMEVGEAYNAAVEMILANPELSKWKYMLTVEEDNIPPQDGLLKLYESMNKYDVVGGLYWTKGECGQPMIYGDPKVMPKSFTPQLPVPEIVQECNGLGMGFNLFKIDIFKKMPKPWFKTEQSVAKGTFTQDLYFYNEAAKFGYKFACDNRIKVGHMDVATGMVW
jgi:hypothetical protein